MSAAKERAEFLAVLGANFSAVPPAALDACARELMSIARAQHKLAEDECNEPEPHEGEREQRRLKLNDRAARVSLALPGLRIKFSGDPRGYTTKLTLPQGQHNTWGGKEAGYGVPT